MPKAATGDPRLAKLEMSSSRAEYPLTRPPAPKTAAQNSSTARTDTTLAPRDRDTH
jgi:hypothetical protein